MNSPILSVIIPMYNASEFFGTGYMLDSILTQTDADFEVILVNDGSKDDTESKAYSVAEKDSRVRVISYSENKGASYARNRGIDSAKGEYIMLPDADDYLDQNALHIMLEAGLKNDADIVTCCLYVNKKTNGGGTVRIVIPKIFC